VTSDLPTDHTTQARLTQEAYDRLAPVWSSTTDDGPWNGYLERPALRSLVPPSLSGATVIDAGCGAGGQAEWLLDQGADVIGLDLSPAMVEEARRRCGGRGRFFVADLAEPLSLDPGSVDGITCSLALHYLRDWTVPLRSFADALCSGGWVVLSLDHPFAPPLPGRRDGYFDTQLVSDTWTKANVKVTQHFWRRPLEATIGAFADAGFAVDRVVEAQPSDDALRRFPDELARVVGVPWFIVYRLRLADVSHICDDWCWASQSRNPISGPVGGE
jgi:SAM-dependent methyltransferase